jgi:hypothetical protein
MKSLFFLLCWLFACRCLSFAQQRVEVKYEPDAKGNYRFFCENNGSCNYIVEVSFTDLQNLRADFRLPYIGEVRPGSNSLFTLAKENPGVASTFRFGYRYVKGCLQPKVNTGYTYLQPVAPGKEVQPREMEYFLRRYMNEPAPQDWYALSLKMKAGDTVYASRRGTVTEVKDDANLSQSGYAMASADNYVEVYHDDCSFARYQVLKDKSIFVKPGQFIEAGDAIGLVGGEKYVMGPHLRFCVYYTLDKDAFTDYDKAGRRSRLAYVPVQFWTKDAGKQKLANGGTYTSEHPRALITQDMSKKEVKKWTEKHKS